jgi:hypothetical protein
MGSLGCDKKKGGIMKRTIQRTVEIVRVHETINESSGGETVSGALRQMPQVEQPPHLLTHLQGVFRKLLSKRGSER